MSPLSAARAALRVYAVGAAVILAQLLRRCRGGFLEPGQRGGAGVRAPGTRVGAGWLGGGGAGAPRDLGEAVALPEVGLGGGRGVAGGGGGAACALGPPRPALSVPAGSSARLARPDPARPFPPRACGLPACPGSGSNQAAPVQPPPRAP